MADDRNEKELTSTTSHLVIGGAMDNSSLLPGDAGNEGKSGSDSNDTVPTSSTDASTSITSTRLVSDDPISSTSSDMDSSKAKASEPVLDAELLDKASSGFDSDAELLEMSILAGPSEKIEENVDDLVNDLETLLGESTESFVSLSKSGSSSTKNITANVSSGIVSELTDIFEEKADNEVSSNTDNSTKNAIPDAPIEEQSQTTETNIFEEKQLETPSNIATVSALVNPLTPQEAKETSGVEVPDKAEILPQETEDVVEKLEQSQVTNQQEHPLITEDVEMEQETVMEPREIKGEDAKSQEENKLTTPELSTTENDILEVQNTPPTQEEPMGISEEVPQLQQQETATENVSDLIIQDPTSVDPPNDDIEMNLDKIFQEVQSAHPHPAEDCFVEELETMAESETVLSRISRIESEVDKDVLSVEIFELSTADSPSEPMDVETFELPASVEESVDLQAETSSQSVAEPTIQHEVVADETEASKSDDKLESVEKVNIQAVVQSIELDDSPQFEKKLENSEEVVLEKDEVLADVANLPPTVEAESNLESFEKQSIEKDDMSESLEEKLELLPGTSLETIEQSKELSAVKEDPTEPLVDSIKIAELQPSTSDLNESNPMIEEPKDELAPTEALPQISDAEPSIVHDVQEVTQKEVIKGCLEEIDTVPIVEAAEDQSAAGMETEKFSETAQVDIPLIEITEPKAVIEASDLSVGEVVEELRPTSEESVSINEQVESRSESPRTSNNFVEAKNEDIEEKPALPEGDEEVRQTLEESVRINAQAESPRTFNNFVEEKNEDMEEESALPEINVRRKTVEQDLEKVVCLSEDSSDSEVVEIATKPVEKPPIIEDNDLVKIAQEVEENPIIEESREGVHPLVSPIESTSNVETISAVAGLESDCIPIVKDDRRLSDKEMREMEAIRMAVASITDSSQDTYEDSFIVEQNDNVFQGAPDKDNIPSLENQNIRITAVEAVVESELVTNQEAALPAEVLTEDVEMKEPEECPSQMQETMAIEEKAPTIQNNIEITEPVQCQVEDAKSHSEEPVHVELTKTDEEILPVKTRNRKNKVNEPLSINVDEVDKKEKIYSPKITIKPIKIPDEEVSTTSEAESNKGSLKMTITKQSDNTHSILKVFNPEDDEEGTQNQEEPIPKLIIKPKMQQLEQQLSPKILTRSSKIYSPTSSRCSSPRITIKAVQKPVEIAQEPPLGPLKITLKPVVKPDESKKHSPKLPKDGDKVNPKITIKPIPKPVEQEIEEITPKVTIRPLKRHAEDFDLENEQGRSSPKITIKPVIKPQDYEQEQTTPKLKIKPIKKHDDEVNDLEKEQISPKVAVKSVTDEEEGDEVKERIILKINKGNLPQTPSKESKKREHPEEEKVGIKLKISTTGGHTHIIQDDDSKRQRKDSGYLSSAAKKDIEEVQKRPLEDKASEKNKRLRTTLSPEKPGDHLDHYASMGDLTNNRHQAAPDVSTIIDLASQTTHIGANPVLTVGIATPTIAPTPKRRGRPRKVPLQIREELKDTPLAGSSPSSESLQSYTGSESSAASGLDTTPFPAGRPKRSCRGQNVIATLGIKPRKPRGRGRGNKVNMGDREPVPEVTVIIPEKVKSKKSKKKKKSRRRSKTT